VAKPSVATIALIVPAEIVVALSGGRLDGETQVSPISRRNYRAFQNFRLGYSTFAVVVRCWAWRALHTAVIPSLTWGSAPACGLSCRLGGAVKSSLRSSIVVRRRESHNRLATSEVWTVSARKR